MPETCIITRLAAGYMAEIVASPDTWDGGLAAQVARLAEGGFVLLLSPERRILSRATPPDEGALTGARIVDVSHGWQPVLLEGRFARDLLTRGIELDLSPAAFAPGQAMATLCARVPVILHAEAEDRFRLFVATSYADWLVDWLTAVLAPLSGAGTGAGVAA